MYNVHEKTCLEFGWHRDYYRPERIHTLGDFLFSVKAFGGGKNEAMANYNTQLTINVYNN